MMRRNHVVVLALVVLLLAAGLAGAVHASPPLPATTTRDVCPSGCPYAGIQAAISAAADGDTLRVAGGPGVVYTERLVISKTVHILGGYAGPPAWPRAAVYTTTIDGSSSGGSAVSFLAGAGTLEGFTITGGRSDMDGGGILISGASPLISATTVISNSAASGGGIAISGGAARIISSAILSNTAQGGGGLLLAGATTATLRDTTIAGNVGYALGGGLLIVDGAAPQIEGCTLRANDAASGGGVYFSTAQGSFSGNSVTGNRATAGSGGGAVLNHSAPLWDANTVLANSATGNGGGLELSGSLCATPACETVILARLTNTIIARNAAQAKGGGVYVAEGTGPSLVNSTIVFNAGEGIYVTTYGVAFITNTIVASNTLGIGTLGPSYALNDYNLVWANTPGGDYSGVAAGAHSLSAEPRFVAAAADNYHLRGDAPAIDRGQNSVAPSADRDGAPRPAIGGCAGAPVADIGAYEYQLPPGSCGSPTLTATPTASPTPVATVSATSTAAPQPTQTATATATPSLAPTQTATATATPSPSRTPTVQPSATASATPARTSTPSATLSPTRSATPPHTATRTAAPARTSTGTPTCTGDACVTPTPTRTGTRTPTPGAEETATPAARPYTVHAPIIVSTFLPACALYEPNDEIAGAYGPLVFDAAYEAYLCAYDPVDWYYIDAPRAGALAITLEVPDLADLDLYVYGADGTAIAESAAHNEGQDELVVIVAREAGRYFVRIDPFSRHAAGQPYGLRAGFD